MEYRYDNKLEITPTLIQIKKKIIDALFFSKNARRYDLSTVRPPPKTCHPIQSQLGTDHKYEKLIA